MRDVLFIQYCTQYGKHSKFVMVQGKAQIRNQSYALLYFRGCRVPRPKVQGEVTVTPRIVHPWMLTVLMDRFRNDFLYSDFPRFPQRHARATVEY